MSESESESQSLASAPADEALEKGLRDAVSQVFKTGNMERLTVKRVRSATEQALSLEDGFFKGHGDWKGRSDEIIKHEAVRLSTIRKGCLLCSSCNANIHAPFSVGGSGTIAGASKGTTIPPLCQTDKDTTAETKIHKKNRNRHVGTNREAA